MINTVVCKKEGCIGNRFKVSVQRLKVLLICTECRSVEKYDREMHQIVPTICTACGKEIFKVCKDVDKNEMYLECVECEKKFIFNSI